jgi:hypothetical protein
MDTNLKHVAAIVTDLGLSMFVDGTNHVVPTDHINYDKILKALREQDWEVLPDLLTPAQQVFKAVQEFTVNDPNFSVEHGVLHYRNRPLPSDVSAKIVRMVGEGQPLTPLLRFVEKLWRNPSNVARQEALLFFVANAMMIHDDGDFLAYKTVDRDYFDKHSRSVLNKPASLLTQEELDNLPLTTRGGVTVEVENDQTVVSMERGDVDDRRDVTCSHGLHFAAYRYAAEVFYSPGDRVVVLKIHPRDVVSIPSDYGNEKGRCCRYVVLAEIEAPENERPEPLPQQEVYSYRDVGASGQVFYRAERMVIDALGGDESMDESDVLCDYPDYCSEQMDELARDLEATFGLRPNALVLSGLSTASEVAEEVEALVMDMEYRVEEEDYEEDENEEDENEEEPTVLPRDTAVEALLVGDKPTPGVVLGYSSEADEYLIDFNGRGAEWVNAKDVALYDPNVERWFGHEFVGGVCRRCKGGMMPLQALGWECPNN